MAKHILPLNTEPKIKVYLHHAYPLSILLSDDQFCTWYYEHFLQIFSVVQTQAPSRYWNWRTVAAAQHDDVEQKLWLDFLEGESAYRNVLHELPLDVEMMRRETDFLGFFKSRIASGFYVIIQLDESQLSPKLNSQNKIPYVYPNLVYGYDDSQKLVYALGFDARWNFSPFTISYAEFERGFEQGLELLSQNGFFETPQHTGWMRLIQRREMNGRYPFDLQRFRRQLHDYLLGMGNSAQNYFASGWSIQVTGDDWAQATQKEMQFGTNIYSQCEAMLRQKAVDDTAVSLEYVSFHLLAEHKLMVQERLAYIARRYTFGPAFEPLLNEFKEVVAEFERLRLQFLRYQSAPNAVLLTRMADMLQAVKQKEVFILSRVYALLLQHGSPIGAGQ